jgi:diguanylate cyclase (GGDEF)-like protein/PAS domain S-box-containing protein
LPGIFPPFNLFNKNVSADPAMTPEGDLAAAAPGASADASLRALNAQLIEKTTLLQTTLDSISQGILMVGADGLINTYNKRVCDLLEIPESVLAGRPTLQDLTLLQLARGDFGPNAQRVDAVVQRYAVAPGTVETPPSYLRTTMAGRVLEVKTQTLTSGAMVRTFADVTDYVRAEADLRASEENIRQITAQVPGMVFRVRLTPDGARKYSFVSEGVRGLYGIGPEEVLADGSVLQTLRHPDDALAIDTAMEKTAMSTLPMTLQFRLKLRDGTVKWAQMASTCISADEHATVRAGVAFDITASKLAEAELRASEERWKLALDSTGDGVWDWNIHTGEEVYSRRFMEMYGFSEAEIASRADEFDTRTHPEDIEQMLRVRQAHMDGLTPTYVNEHRIRCKDDSWKWIMTRGMVISRDAAGKPLRMIGTHTDITSRKEAEALIWQQANFDALTGLPNRRMLRDRIEQEIKKGRREDGHLAILFIDLDHFKEVNDTLGHDRGDLLLVEAARRIRKCVRESDTVARMGGDEFTVVLPDLAGSDSMARITQDILTAMAEVFQLGDEQVFVSASIGITVYPQDATEVEGLFKNADQALYVAKGAGRNRFSFFTPALQEVAQTRVRLTSDLRAGLAQSQFFMAYQPIVELATGDIYKAEALIRWQHPTRGLISPAAFIPIAEASGLIIDIGNWVFRQVADQAKTWRDSLHPQFQISLNKSPLQFHHASAPQGAWLAHLQALGLPGSAIVVEITEGLLLDASSAVTLKLIALRDTGIQVSLDDFGTGYSSLSYLQRFEIDYIKIDQSFVRHLIPASTDLALCKAIIVMAHELGIKVIAEGIETEGQRELLLAAGCDYGQGYLFARPMPAADFEAFLAQR